MRGTDTPGGGGQAGCVYGPRAWVRLTGVVGVGRGIWDPLPLFLSLVGPE